MWLKWFPWRFTVKHFARSHGFLDPIKILSQLQNFAQPSEVAAPTELLRSGVILHARGLMNSQAIQHNLDWVWPYWVNRQYDPSDDAFIPRSFSLTQINLTHRNWTAVGIPDCEEYPIVDPRGLVTPLYDGWSIDSWIIVNDGKHLIPSQSPSVDQTITYNDNLCVITGTKRDHLSLRSNVQVIGTPESPHCTIEVTAQADVEAWLVVSLRPYNPEGVSFIHDIALLDDRKGWQVNKNQPVYWDTTPDRCEFSYYRHGDVFSRLAAVENKSNISCHVGMATAAAFYKLEKGKSHKIVIDVPLKKEHPQRASLDQDQLANQAWKKNLEKISQLSIPNKHFQSLFEIAVRTVLLHSPKEVYPGPYTYRRFWFRDAAFIIHAMLSVGLKDRSRRTLSYFRSRQTKQGYFLSQEGEWDSNGESLWIMHRFCELTKEAPPAEWKNSIDKAARWLCKKRTSKESQSIHAGLLPSGFSAEHFGPNDYYYWDDFWAVAGLNAAGHLLEQYGDKQKANNFFNESNDLARSIEQSLGQTAKRLGRPAMPASPYRRMDGGAIGSIVCGYPLQIFSKNDTRLLDTTNFLLENRFINGAFFHDMTHSGINPYLTLHIAQVLLRAGDRRYFDLMAAVAKLATSTGQWPEAIHPRTGGGCMGDGQHVWAAAEWILMIRSCFVREESDRLILCSGIPENWLHEKSPMVFGFTATKFGDIKVTVVPHDDTIKVTWEGKWFSGQPPIDIQFPGYSSYSATPNTNIAEIKYKDTP
jgi:hypothetical protein